MFKTITKELSKNEVIDLLRGMDAQEVEDNFSVRRVLIDTQACDVFGGDPEDSYPLIPGTYMAFYYKSLVGDPYPFFEKVCANLIEDGEMPDVNERRRLYPYFHAQQVRVAKNVLRHFPGHTM